MKRQTRPRPAAPSGGHTPAGVGGSLPTRSPPLPYGCMGFDDWRGNSNQRNARSRKGGPDSLCVQAETLPERAVSAK